MARKNMGTIKPGDHVTLRFYTWGGDSYTEPATFLGDVPSESEVGRTDKRFESFDEFGKSYTWEAYRYQGSWAYGTSAQRLTVAQED